MKDLDALLRNNRLDMDIHFEFRGITCWTVSLTFHPCRGNIEEVFSEQFYTYSEMKKALMNFLIEFDKKLISLISSPNLPTEEIGNSAPDINVASSA